MSRTIRGVGGLRRKVQMLVPLTILVACSGSDKPATTLDRVSVLHSAAVGSHAGSPFGSIDAAVALSDGRIAVLDHTNSHVDLLSPTGAVEHVIGRAGSGPSEFASAIDIAAGPGGLVAVADMGNRRISFWRSTGQFVGAVPAPFWLRLIGGTAGFFLTMPRFEKSGMPSDSLLDVVRVSAAGVDSIPWLTVHTSDNGARSGQAATCKFCDIVPLDSERVVFASGSGEYRLFARDRDGTAVTSWSLASYKPVMRSGRELAELRAQFKRHTGSAELPAAFSQPKRAIAMNAVTLAGPDLLVVLPAVSDSTPSRLDVFDRSGTFVQSVQLSESLNSIHAWGSELVGVAADTGGEPSLHIYDVEVDRR